MTAETSINTHLLAFGLGWGEVMVILVVVLILFGAKRLPELAKGLGTGIKEFKKATRDVQEDIQRSIEDTPPSPPRRPTSSGTPETAAPKAGVAHD